MALKYGYSSSRSSSGVTTYTNRSGQSVGSGEATTGTKSNKVNVQAKGVKVGDTPTTQARVYRRTSSGGKGAEVTGAERDKALQPPEPTQTGVIAGKVYEKVTEREILNNKLNADTQAQISAQRTEQRQRLTTAQAKIKSGQKLTFSDTEALATSGRGGGIDLSPKNERIKDPVSFIKKVDRYNLESDAYAREQRFGLKTPEVTTQTKDERFLESRAIAIDKRTQETNAGIQKRLNFLKLTPKADDSKPIQYVKAIGSGIYFSTAGFFTLDTGKTITGAVDKAVFKAQLSYAVATGKAPSLIEARKESGRVSRAGVVQAISPVIKGDGGKYEINPQGLASITFAGIGAGIKTYVAYKNPTLKTTNKITDVNLKGNVKQRVTTTATKTSPNIPQPKGTSVLSYKQGVKGIFNIITGKKAQTTIKTTPTGKIIKTQTFGGKKYVTTQKAGVSTATLKIYKGGKLVRSLEVKGFNKVQSKGQLLKSRESRLTQQENKNTLTQQVRVKSTTEIDIPINSKYSLRGDIKSDTYTFSTTKGRPGAITQARGDVVFKPKETFIKVKDAKQTFTEPRVKIGNTKQNPDVFASGNKFKATQIEINTKGAVDLKGGSLSQKQTFSPPPQTRYSVKSDFGGPLYLIDKNPRIKPHFSLKLQGKRAQSSLFAPTETINAYDSYVSRLSPAPTSFNLPGVEITGSKSPGVVIPVVPLTNTKKVSILKPKGDLFPPDFDFETSNKYKVNQIGKTDNILDTDTSQDLYTREKTRNKTKQTNRQATEQIRDTIQQPKTELNEIRTPRVRTPPIFSIFNTNLQIPEIPLFITPFKFGETKKSSIKLGGFNVLARKGGKFLKINTGGALSYSEAKNFGAYSVDKSLRATFKVVDAKESAKSSFKQKGNFGNFYTKEEDGDTLFIEKRSARLNTPGEVRQIRGKKTTKKLKGSIFNV